MYDLTIILPFYKKYKELKYALPYNYNEYKKAKEVIIIIDHLVDHDKLSFLSDYDINFKFFNNERNHPWRNPATTINKGIKEASGKYIMIFSPESILFNNVVDNLYKNCSENTYSYGNVSFMTKKYFEKQDYVKLLNIFKEKKTVSYSNNKFSKSMSFSGPVSKNMSFSGPVSKSMSFSGPVSKSMSFSGPVSKNMSFSGPVSKNMSFSGPVSKSMSFSGPVSKSMSFNQSIKVECTDIYMFGSICVTKKNLNKIENYNDKFILWGGDDNNIRYKLDSNNITGNYIKNSNLIHLEFTEQISTFQSNKTKNSKKFYDLYKYLSYNDKKNLLQNSNILSTIKKIEYEINKIRYSLSVTVYNKISIPYSIKKINKLNSIKNILNNKVCNYIYNKLLILNEADSQSFNTEIKSLKFDKFQKYSNIVYKEPFIDKISHKIKFSNNLINEVIINKTLSKNIDILLLAPCYNEEHNIDEFINNTKHLVSEVIMLDDGSSDNSWNIIKNNDNIKIKLLKKREYFNDINNRNILLDTVKILITHNINIKWVLWLDLDERIGNIDIDYLKKNIINNNNNVLSVPFYHMWNKTDYNALYGVKQIDKTNLNIVLNSKYKTINFYNRLFKINNIRDDLSIKTDKKLHFDLTPTVYRNLPSSNCDLQVYHLSTNTPDKRNKKYLKYLKYDIDNNQKDYSHLLENIPLLIKKFVPIY